MKSGWWLEGGTRNVVPVSSTVPSANTMRAEKYLVTIGMCVPQFMPEGVVHDDAAYHGRFHACRVRSKLTSVGRENLVDPLADEMPGCSDLFMIGRNAVLLPMLSRLRSG